MPAFHHPGTRRRVPHELRALRVLHVDTAREWRGGQRQLLRLAMGLRAEGIEPLVVAPPGSPLLARCKAEGIASASFAMRSGLDLLAIRRLRRLLVTWRPHVVHAHDARAHALLDAALLGRRQATPLVVTHRSTLVPARTRRRRRRVARFVAISSAVRDALGAAGVTPGRVSLVYPGVSAPAAETPRDWKAEAGWPAATVVAGIVGPLTRGGREDELARILAHLPSPDRARLGLVLLGGPAAGRGTVGGFRVMRAGFVHDVGGALRGLDLLLHPGDAEGLGTAVIEAMALGIPIVAFDAGGIAEIVAHERNGLLAPPGDARAFAAATARLVEDAALRRRLGAAGPTRAGQFDVPHYVGALVALYREVLEGAAP